MPSEPARCRPAGPADLALLLPLLLDMERDYEGEAAIGEEQVRDRLAAALAGDPPGLFLLAEAAGQALGLATLFALFPGRDLGQTWYLKDIYVASHARGQAVGEALIRAAAGAVLARGGTRLEFSTGTENSGAQRFYDRLGLPRQAKVHYRAEATDLRRLAE